MKKLIAAALLAVSGAALALPNQSTVYVTRGGSSTQPFCVTERSARAVLSASAGEAGGVFENLPDCQLAKAGLRYEVMQRATDAGDLENLRRVLILSESGPNVEVWFYFQADAKEVSHEH